MEEYRRLATVLLFVGLVLLAPLAGTVAATDAATEENAVAIDDDLAVWDRAPFSLVADDADASVAVETPGVFVETAADDAPDARLDRGPVGVYETGEEVTLAFGDHDNVDAAAFDGEIQVLQAYADEPMDDGVDPASLVGPQLLADLGSDDLNDEVTFSLERATLEDGTLEHAVAPNRPGHYATVVATGGFEVADGDVVAVDDATVLGAEQFLAHEEPAGVDAPDDVRAGDDVDVDVDATALNGDVDHAVALYDANAFATSELTLSIDGGLDALPVSEDVSLESSIDGLEGVHDRDHPAVDAVLDRLLAADGTSADGDALAASTARTTADADADLTVGTLESWGAGEYRLLHVASDASGELQVGTETVSLADADRGPSLPSVAPIDSPHDAPPVSGDLPLGQDEETSPGNGQSDGPDRGAGTFVGVGASLGLSGVLFSLRE